MTYFFTSDQHFGHANIIPLAKRPFPYEVRENSDGTREVIVPPSSVEAMNELMVERWNKKVGRYDVVYHLGDFAWHKEAAKWALDRLNGHIVLIEGNHDYPIDGLHHKFASIQPYREVTIEGQKIVLFHYPIRSWNGIFKGSWHLHGHTHDLLPPFGKSFDIGVDKWSFEPLSFEEVKVYMDSRPLLTEEKGFAAYEVLKSQKKIEPSIKGDGRSWEIGSGMLGG